MITIPKERLHIFSTKKPFDLKAMSFYSHTTKGYILNMSRRISFKEQMFRVLNSKNCFGQSKYQAKRESYQNGCNGKVDGIYSKKTMSDYKKVATQFHEWQKEKGYNFRSMSDVKPNIIKEYLFERQANGHSSWTISHDLSALNKVFNTTLSKKECGLASRRSENIKNNRGFGNNYRASVYAKNQDLITFISSCGVRRQSLTMITPANAIRDKDNIVIGFHVVEKGGKQRNCYVRNEYQSQITAFVNTHLETQGNVPFWNKVDKNFNTHWYRGEYAKGLYNDLLEAKANGEDYFHGYQDIFINQRKLEQVTQRHKSSVKGYDTQVMAMVSQNMGHNRIDVVYVNYLGH